MLCAEAMHLAWALFDHIGMKWARHSVRVILNGTLGVQICSVIIAHDIRP